MKEREKRICERRGHRKKKRSEGAGTEEKNWIE